MTTKKRQNQFKLILVLFPFIILAVIEIALRISGYGNKSKLYFIPKYVPEIYIENVAGYNKYQENQNKITTDKIENHIRNLMQITKNPGAIRGFVVGGSAAQGYPYNSNQSFSKMIEVALFNTGRYSEVEVLNMAVSAISSYSVKDIAKKSLKYDPDFLIVYAGNNEYYGTFSQVTGGNHFTRELYMSLYELNLFQLVNDFILMFSTESSGDQINMRERYQQAYMAKNTETDRLVAQNYIKNIESIINWYNKKNIPVIVVEPICNLIDMAPFKGENDNEIARILIGIENLINIGDIQLADSALRLLSENHQNNANRVFLEAKLEMKKNGNVHLEKLIEAKDNDIIPFRPREVLIGELFRFYNENKEIYNNMHYIPLKKIISNLYGDTILGNSIFIDHVHFNQKGHKIMAEIISKELAHVLGFNNEELDTILTYFSDEEAVYQSIYSLPMFRMYANKVVHALISESPFKEMVFPYEFDQTEFNTALKALGTELVKKILHMDKGESFRLTVLHYLEREEYQLTHQYLIADKISFPGSYQRYLNLGKFFRMFENFIAEAEQNYTQAFLLSEKNQDIYREIMDFFYETNQLAKAQEFQKKHGRLKK